MSVTQHVFPQFMPGVAAGDITLPGSGWKIALGDAAGPVTLATTGIAAAKLFTDWTAIVPEITGTGYTAGGVAISGMTFAAGGTDDSVSTLDTSSTPTWTGATFSANQAVLYQSGASTYQLAAFWDFGGALSPADQTFELTINANGLLTATVS